MRISEFTIETTFNNAQTVLILDENELDPARRLKRVLLSRLLGQTGQTGAPGQSAYQAWISVGNTGNTQDFINSLKGTPGKSAYQTWVDTGNTGNESEFLESLIGPEGPGLYDTWLAAGNTGTEQDYLDTISGPPGASGSTIFTASGNPNNSNGADNDYYVDSATGAFYHKVSGSWGTALFNLQGTHGTIWYTGNGIPTAGIGTVNDYYLNLTNGNVYGPKVLSTWPIFAAGNIRGPQGVQGLRGVPGSAILTGSTTPSSGLGVNGDFYLNTTTGEFFGPKASNVWPSTPTAVFIVSTFNLGFHDGTGDLKFNRTYAEGLYFDQAGDVTLEFDNVNRLLRIGSTTTWSTLQNKPNDIAGYGITDVYTTTDIDQLFLTGVEWDNVQNKPTTLSGYGITDVYTKDEVDDEISSALAGIAAPIKYLGNWDPTLNVPTLSDSDVNVASFLYNVTDNGTVNFGNGPISFNAGDKVVNNGTVWEKWDQTDAVTLVNGQAGIVTLTSNDVPESGSGNLYFSNLRAQIAARGAVADSFEITLGYDSGVGFIIAQLRNGTIANARLINSSLTIGSTSIALGANATLDTIFGLSTNGFIKRTAANTYASAVAGTDYAAPTNGTTGQLLVSNGSGGFGIALSPLKVGTAAFVITCLGSTETSFGEDLSILYVVNGYETFRVPYGVTLTTIKASLKTAQASGTKITIDVKKNGSSIFSTLLTFDNAEKTTMTAAIPAVLSTNVLADDDEISIDVTQVGDGTAAGLKLYFIGSPTP